MLTADPSNADSTEKKPANDIYSNPLTNPKIIPVSTKYGYVVVTQQGPPNRPVIVTYHDVGFNSATQFHEFFALPEMLPITERFTVYHINAPGQDDQANPLPTSFVYPTLDQLAVSVNDIFTHLNIQSAIGFGIGLGANVLTRFALGEPNKVYGLILINCIPRTGKWLEAFSVKRATKDVMQQQWTDSLLKYLVWYHLGPETQSSDPELAQMIRQHLEENVQARNVIKLMNSFFNRTAIPIDRPKDSDKKSHTPRTLKCTVLNVTGATSPHKNDVQDMNDRCDSTMSSYVELADCGGAALLEQPSKMAESIRLFLQGLGYMSHLSIPQYSTANRLAEQSAEYKRRFGSLSKVPRRLSSQVYFGNYDEKRLGVSDDDPRLRANSFNARDTKF